MKNWYGCLGFVSVLGFCGLYGDEPLFCSFFAFLVFFQYFWITPDEMFLDTMKKSAAAAFFTNLCVTAAVTLGLTALRLSGNPLAAGAAAGFGASVAVFAFSSFLLEARERMHAGND